MSFDSSIQCDTDAECFAARADITGINVIATQCAHVGQQGVCQCDGNAFCGTAAEPVCRGGDLAGPVDAVVGAGNGETCQV